MKVELKTFTEDDLVPKEIKGSDLGASLGDELLGKIKTRVVEKVESIFELLVVEVLVGGAIDKLFGTIFLAFNDPLKFVKEMKVVKLGELAGGVKNGVKEFGAGVRDEFVGGSQAILLEDFDDIKEEVLGEDITGDVEELKGQQEKRWSRNSEKIRKTC